MRVVFLFTIFLCSALAACATRPAQPPPSDSKVSFGIYDISSSSPFSIVTEAMEKAIEPEPATLGGMGRTEEKTSTVDARAADPTQDVAVPTNAAPSDRKIIRNGELNLEAENPEEAQRRITGIAEQKGGFVVESQQSSSDTQATSRDIVAMTVRVPSGEFAQALAEIRNTATRVVSETVKGQDVTEEFIDIEAQLNAKRALEEQFMTIMKRANSVEEALNVQGQLADVRGEIERIEGRKRFLENQSSLSTIKIRIQTAKVFAASSAGFGTRLAEAFSSGFDVAMSFVLWLVTFVIALLPFAAFIGLPLFAIIRYVLKRQARPKSVMEIAVEEIKRA